MKWKILKLETSKDNTRYGCFFCENENGEKKWLDLFTDDSYEG